MLGSAAVDVGFGGARSFEEAGGATGLEATSGSEGPLASVSRAGLSSGFCVTEGGRVGA